MKKITMTSWKKTFRSYQGTLIKTKDETIVGMLDENDPWLVFGRLKGFILTKKEGKYHQAYLTDKGLDLAKSMADSTERTMW